MSSNNLTRAFSDSAEFQRRVDRTMVEYSARKNADVTDAESKPETEGSRNPKVQRKPATLIPAELGVRELTEAFNEASLAALPEARVVLGCPRWDGTADLAVVDSAAIRLPHSVGGWEMIGIEQRTHDVDLTIQLPFYIQPSGYSQRLIPNRLWCQLLYNPADDNCLLVNRSGLDIQITSLGPPERRDLLRSTRAQLVGPGLWRISVKGEGSSDKHLVDILILQRRFSVAIHEAVPSPLTSAKRPSRNEDGVPAKRRRAGDTTGIFMAHASHFVEGAPTDVAPDLLTSRELKAGPARQIARRGGTPLLDLGVGELAVIRTAQSGTDASSPPQGAVRPESYELRRLDRIHDTPSASVFTSRHSALTGNVVAKVMRYGHGKGADLMRCANGWKHEKSFLEKLRHRNIMSLKAFDGRLFAMYVEHLPKSLHRSTESPFTPSDASIILRDISSALAYLVTQQVLHNDIKPANIAYSPERGAVLLDFGLAESSASPRPTGGTPWYMPPESLSQKVRGAPGDVWALGVTMLYVLGEIQLPERTGKGWIIKDLRDETAESHRRMKRWIDFVEQGREKLDRTGLVEDLVYKMLQRPEEARIRAAQISTSLETSK